MSAPAGYGKTTLLSQWVAEPASPDSAWVTLDSGDADPTRFWRYVLSALAEIAPPAGRQSLPALARRPERVQTEILPILMEELEQAGRDLVLVLEDYHLAECAPVAESVAYFADNRPLHIQLVVSARSDPYLPLGRWRANDQLAEIRSEQLRFGEEEVVEFFRGAGIDGFSPAQLGTLTARTEGWPAALRLATIIVGTQGDGDDVVQAFAGSTRQVADYLATEVLQSVPLDLRAFLLQTSVLPCLCGPLCDMVTGRTDSAAVLRDLSQAGLFIDPVGLDGRWYRYHQLFAEALGLELEVAVPQLVPALHARASAWFEQEGHLESAIEHAIAARDAGLAGRLILSQLGTLRGAGHLATVERWLAALSWSAALEEPDLAVARAITAGERSRPDQAGLWLDVADDGPRDTLTAAGLPRGFRTDLLRSLFVAGGVGAAHEAALRAIEEAPAPRFRGAALAGLAQCGYLLGQYDVAGDAASQALTLLPDDPNLLSLASGYLALVECHRGSPERAEGVARQAVEIVESRNVALSGTTAICYLGLAAALIARGHLAEADDRLNLATELYQAGEPSVWLAQALILVAACQHAEGKSAQARDALKSTQATLDRLPDAGILPTLAAAEEQKLVGSNRRPAAFGQKLSERELAVLGLLAGGLTLSEIAVQLHVSRNTIKTQLRTAYRKLGAGTRVQALRRAAEVGLL